MLENTVLSHSSSNSGHFAGGKPFFTRWGIRLPTPWLPSSKISMRTGTPSFSRSALICLGISMGAPPLMPSLVAWTRKTGGVSLRKTNGDSFCRQCHVARPTAKSGRLLWRSIGSDDLRIARVEVRGEIHAEIASRGITGDADLVRIEAPLRSALPHEAHRAFRIEQGERLDARVVELVRRTQAILQADDGDAFGLKTSAAYSTCVFQSSAP